MRNKDHQDKNLKKIPMLSDSTFVVVLVSSAEQGRVRLLVHEVCPKSVQQIVPGIVAHKAYQRSQARICTTCQRTSHTLRESEKCLLIGGSRGIDVNLAWQK